MSDDELDYSADPRVRTFEDSDEDSDNVFLSRGFGPGRWAVPAGAGDGWDVVGRPDYDLEPETLGSYATLTEAIFAVLGPPAVLIEEGEGRYRMHAACDVDSGDPADHVDVLVEYAHKLWCARLERTELREGVTCGSTPEQAIDLFF